MQIAKQNLRYNANALDIAAGDLTQKIIISIYFLSYILFLKADQLLRIVIIIEAEYNY